MQWACREKLYVLKDWNRSRNTFRTIKFFCDDSFYFGANERCCFYFKNDLTLRVGACGRDMNQSCASPDRAGFFLLTFFPFFLWLRYIVRRFIKSRWLLIPQGAVYSNKMTAIYVGPTRPNAAALRPKLFWAFPMRWQQLGQLLMHNVWDYWVL